MNKDKIYQLLVIRMNEANVIPPQEVGLFTPIYKKIVPQFKIYPWKITFFLSLLVVLLSYFIFGTLLVKLASLLQYGF